MRDGKGDKGKRWDNGDEMEKGMKREKRGRGQEQTFSQAPGEDSQDKLPKVPSLESSGLQFFVPIRNLICYEPVLWAQQ